MATEHTAQRGMKILNVLPSIHPRVGGTLEAMRQQSEGLIRMGHQVEVLCLDAPDDAHVKEGMALKVHALGPSRGHFAYNARLTSWLRDQAGGFDVLFVHGLWQYHAVGVWWALRRQRVPYFVYTHGMLDPWFKKTYPIKHLKKWLYWPWADYRVLRDAQAVLFTCEEERLLARQSFWLYRAREEVVAFGASQASAETVAKGRAAFLNQFPMVREQRCLLFLGRIQAKKACDVLINAFAQQAERDPRLRLIMAGPDQEGWAAALQAQAQQLGVADRLVWTGLLLGEMKWGALAVSELLVLPSHQENFGVVVAEALGMGRPVMISNKVNIWREVLADDAGLVGDDTTPATARNLATWLDLTPAERQAMGRRARQCFERRFTVEAMASSLLSVAERYGIAAHAPDPAQSMG